MLFLYLMLNPKLSHLMKRIKRFGIFQTAKIGGLMYFALGCLLIPLFGIQSMLMSAFATDSPFPFGSLFFIGIPFIYGILGFIMTAIMCAIYNFVVSLVGGGIEFEFETFDD